MCAKLVMYDEQGKELLAITEQGVKVADGVESKEVYDKYWELIRKANDSRVIN